MTSDWNATLYDRISEPQFTWGLAVLARLAVDGHERALDVGCGTGRLTVELARRLPHGKVTATDRSRAMLEKGAALLRGNGIPIVLSEATQLPFSGAFDLIFSTATFHWVLDQDALFGSLFHALRPGGRVHAQCGGGPNLARLLHRADLLMHAAPFARYFGSWQEPWRFGGAEDTAARLKHVGFDQIATTLESAPVLFEGSVEFQTFINHVCIRPHLAVLPVSLRGQFSDELVRQAASDTPAFTLDYWRLNISASRPRG